MQYFRASNVLMGMDTALTSNTGVANAAMAEKDQRIAEAVRRERGRLKNFIRQRVPDPIDAEDILQDVFYEFVEAYRLPEPIEQVGAWLYRVARNRIIDRFRKKKETPLAELPGGHDEQHWLEEILPSAEDGPEAALSRTRLIEALQAALGELPAAQRDVFIAHEIEGRSFMQMAEESGTAAGTLLARKRQAVRRLKARLQSHYTEFKD
jgi:RNA polymerase sigma factor (sigma-70 family)